MEFPPLEIVQRWMQTVIQHAAPTGSDAATEIPVSGLITGSQRQSPIERLAIYSNAYLARLLECLKAEFPAVRQAVGDEAFAGLVVGYLRACPPSSYTLHDLGAGFADYLAITRPQPVDATTPDFADFLIDLARLERTYTEVFDAAGPETFRSLSVEELRAATPEWFANAQLLFHETVRLLVIRFPCHEYASGVRSGKNAVLPPPTPTHLLIFRRDYVVRRTPISLPQFELLSELLDGVPVGAAIQAITSKIANPSDLPAQLQGWFAEWAGIRLFRGRN